MASGPIAFEDYARHDGLALSAGVRKGDFSALELVETAIARLEAVNPKINAVAVPIFEAARQRAAGPISGPFGGVPFLMKDLNQGMKGVRLTNGSRAFADNVCSEDSESARRFSAAGLITIASTTSPEFGLTVTTESLLFGKTRNPWNLDRIAGGSSGGSAALCAAGVVPLAHATDGGGSIRVPASCCGLFGLKVSRGRTPVGMGRTEGWNGLGVSHAVTRSVRDSAALLDATHGPEAGSRTVAQPPKGTFLGALERPAKRLRIALQRNAFTGAEPHPHVLAAVEAAAKLCADLGHEIVEDLPLFDAQAVRRALMILISAHTAATVDQRAQALGRPIRDDEIEPVTAAIVENGRQLKATDMVEADLICMQAAEAIGRFLETHDAILSATNADPPPLLGTLSLDIDPRQNGLAVGRFSPYTALYNQTGHPAMSVPLGWSQDGLPIGVMFAGRLGDEETLLALAGQLETAKPWFDRLPPL